MERLSKKKALLLLPTVFAELEKKKAKNLRIGYDVNSQREIHHYQGKH
jgi:hypothetical protein